MNRHRFVGEWLALLKSNVTFWPYLIWLHHASQVGVRAGTMERTSPLALPAPQHQKRQPGDQKSTVQKWHPPGKPCSLPLLRHCSDPWQIIWECHGCPWLPSSYGDHGTEAETPPQNWFSMISCSSSRVSTGSCRNCETVICIFQVLAIGLWRGEKKSTQDTQGNALSPEFLQCLLHPQNIPTKSWDFKATHPKNQTLW